MTIEELHQKKNINTQEVLDRLGKYYYAGPCYTYDENGNLLDVEDVLSYESAIQLMRERILSEYRSGIRPSGRYAPQIFQEVSDETLASSVN